MTRIVGEPKIPKPPGLLRAAWQKYGLIVVGNLVFFALLYFVQYRPNSRDARATELLTMAQREENEQRLEAAETLYARVLHQYAGTDAHAVAKERVPKVLALKKKRAQIQPPLPAACAPSVDLAVLLEQKPSFYIAELVAGHYPALTESARERSFTVIADYVWLPLNLHHVALYKLRKNPIFRAGELQQRYFALKARARFSPDYVYDDFKVRNLGYFTLHNVVIDLWVAQGDS